MSVCDWMCVWPVLHISDWYGNNLTSRCFICFLVKLQVPHFHPSLNMNFKTTQYSRLTMTLSNKGHLVTHTHTNTHRLKPKYAGFLYETRDICSFQSPHLRDLDERGHATKSRFFFQGFHLISKTIKLKVKDQTCNSIHHERHKILFQRFLISFLERVLRDGPQHRQKLLPYPWSLDNLQLPFSSLESCIRDT